MSIEEMKNKLKKVSCENEKIKAENQKLKEKIEI